MKLKVTLLYTILETQTGTNKYSRSFSVLSNVFRLEASDGFEFPSGIQKKYEELKKKYNNFMSGIPLTVIERYYNEHSDKLNKFVYLEYGSCELTDLRIIELYEHLENFFQEIYSIACDIANYYNIEIKLNTKSSKGSQNYL